MGVFFFSFRFFLFLVLFLPIAYVFTVLLVHFPAHLTDQGITDLSSAGIFAIWGASLIVGYLISSISDYYGRTPTFLIGSLLGVLSMFLIGKYNISFDYRYKLLCKNVREKFCGGCIALFFLLYILAIMIYTIYR